MKKLSLISIVIVLTVVFFNSCEREKAVPDLTVDVIGKYVGDLIDSETKITKSATVDVAKSGENEVEIHCYGEFMDTTFVMDLYENADSIMVCFSDEDSFFNQYGHHMSGSHHMMGDNDGYNWMHHMNDEHENGDEHFGGFDTNMHTFNYLFRVGTVPSLKEFHFIGNKQ